VEFAAADRQTGHGLRVDWINRQVMIDNAPVRLTPMEWKALERLAWNPGELVTHQDLFRHLYGSDRHYRAQSTAVRVLITKLRRLLPLRIEAQWRRGYVISGLGSSLPAATAADNPATQDAPTALPPPRPPLPREAPRASSFAAKPEKRASAPLRSAAIELRETTVRAFTPATRPGLGRTEELGVIEQFLAERGVTRCPDVATIQRQPLPTLVWDKVKRKWVRPMSAEREAIKA
jgi:DNA-binding winged helix-turn-helix (wHTH) protein